MEGRGRGKEGERRGEAARKTELEKERRDRMREIEGVRGGGGIEVRTRERVCVSDDKEI